MNFSTLACGQTTISEAERTTFATRLKQPKHRDALENVQHLKNWRPKRSKSYRIAEHHSRSLHQKTDGSISDKPKSLSANQLTLTMLWCKVHATFWRVSCKKSESFLEPRRVHQYFPWKITCSLAHKQIHAVLICNSSVFLPGFELHYR